MAELSAFVGSWHLTVFEQDGPPTRALCTLGADGTLVSAEHPVVTPPGAPGVIFTSSGHGVWKAVGPERAIITFAAFGSTGDGNLFGELTVRANLSLDLTTSELTGEGVAMLHDPAGGAMAAFPARIEGVRIVAEAPEAVMGRPTPAATVS